MTSRNNTAPMTNDITAVAAGHASSKGSGEQRVLIFPALTTPVNGKQLSFLFSVSQLEDILLETEITQVPYAPPHIFGVTDWRDRVLPVVSVEKCLGLISQDAHAAIRFLVIKSVRHENGKSHENYGMLRVSRQIQMYNLPIQCSPAPGQWIPREHLVRQVFEWEHGFLIVPQIQAILDGKVRAGEPHV